MRSRIVQSCLLLILLLFLSGVVSSAEVDFRLDGSKVLFINTTDSGQWWKSRLIVENFIGTYVEYLEVDSYYQQWGTGIEVVLSHSPTEYASGLLGGELYKLFDNKNLFLRTGLRQRYPLALGELEVVFDLMIDGYLGVFPRYYAELKLFEARPKINLGVGNILGSDDGYAMWFGINF